MNLLEKSIAFINPRMGLIRSQYRQAIGVVEKQRQYDAAANSRRTKGWKATGTSSNAEIEYSLPWLRARSREMVRNNVYARKSKRVIANNTVGAGILPSPEKLKTKSGKSINAKVKKLWQEWGETVECDFDGLHTFYGLEKLIMSAVVESGEVLVLKRRYKNRSGVPLQLQVVECDLIDHTKTSLLVDRSGSFVIQGIEFDKNGKRTAYWLWDQHPGDQFTRSFNMVSRRIPAEDVLHIYYVDRPGQIRGVPFMAAAMLKMRDADDYEDTQLIRQKIAACFSVFITDFNGNVDNIGNLNKGKDSSGKTQLQERVEPGMITRTPPGTTVEFGSPPAAEGYESYMRKIQQAIAAGVGITYESMTGDLSKTNFSSGRMGWIEMSREVEDWQQVMLIPRLCQPVWSWFMDASIIAGKLNASVGCTWTTPRREMIDPVKETNAKISAARAGLKSMPELLREDGYSPEDTLEEIREWNEQIDEAKIKLDTDARNKINGPNLDVQPAEVTVVE